MRRVFCLRLVVNFWESFLITLECVKPLWTFMIRQLIILSSFTLVVHFSFGQRIDWSIYDCAAFKEDTTLRFLTTIYREKYGAPFSNITASNAIFELRVFPNVLTREDLPIKIFQFYQDSTILTEHYLVVDPKVENFIKKYRDSASEVYTKGITPLLGKTDGRIWTSVRKHIQVDEAKDMIEELTRMNLFTIEIDSEIETIEKRINNDTSYTPILKTHQLNKGPVNYRFSVFFEIKYKSKYRVFRTGGVFFYFKDKYNGMESSIGGFIIGRELLKYLMPKKE